MSHRFIRFHAGIFSYFTSEPTGLMKVPNVHWEAGMHVHGNVEARVLGVLGTTSSAGVDPFHVFNLSMLGKLKGPQWFVKTEFATENPGVLRAGLPVWGEDVPLRYFHGTFGIKTHGVLNPTLSLDSLKGLNAAVAGLLLSTDVIPTFWVIFAIVGIPRKSSIIAITTLNFNYNDKSLSLHPCFPLPQQPLLPHHFHHGRPRAPAIGRMRDLPKEALTERGSPKWPQRAPSLATPLMIFRALP